MVQRRLYTKEAMIGHYRRLQDPMALCRENLEMDRVIFECNYTPSIQASAFAKQIPQSQRIYELIAGYYTLNEILGERLTKELVHIAQHQTLSATFGLRKTLLTEMDPEEEVDLQVVLLLTVLREIAYSQTFEDPMFFMVQLIDELDLPPEFHDKVITNAVSVELIDEAHNKEHVNHADHSF